MSERPAVTSKPEDAGRWAALNARTTPAWFDEARLGFFVHWGAYSVAGWAEPIGELGAVKDELAWYSHNPYAEWFYNTIRVPGSPAAEYFAREFPGASYDDLLDLWRKPTVDYDALFAALRAAGAGYVVLTTKHHDGITLWDAPGTEGRNTVQRGPHEDLVDAYATAARRAGVRFGAYYSGGLDWYQRPFPPHTTHASVRDDRPLDAEYAAYAAEHLRDLIARHAPDVLWNDIDWPDAGKDFSDFGLGRVFEEYYAAVPEGVVNDRWHVPHRDYATSEYQFMLSNEGGTAWENCRGIGLSFGYNRNEEAASMNAPAAIRHLIDVTTRGGHLLLGITPKADGTLPDFQMRVLAGLAHWMEAAGSVLAGMGAVAGDAPARLVGDGFLRCGTSKGETYLFVDALDGANGVTLELDGDFTMLTPDFFSIEQRDGSVLVTLAEDRPGAAVLRLQR